MNRKNKILVTGGLTLTLAGVGAFVKYEFDGNSIAAKSPEVRRIVNAESELSAAIENYERVPEMDRLNYTPQSAKFDYDIGQAHSQVEQATQRLDSARSCLDELWSNPNNDLDVKEYTSAQRKEKGGFLAAIAGLALTYFGFRRYN